jgi:hypothetical protein
VFSDEEHDIQDKASDLIAFAATSDPDIMYWHQASQEPDRVDFLKAAVKEVESHVKGGESNRLMCLLQAGISGVHALR